jgi:hypothetical protein
MPRCPCELFFVCKFPLCTCDFPLALAREPQPCPAVPANYSLFASFPSALAVFPSRSREGLNRALRAATHKRDSRLPSARGKMQERSNLQKQPPKREAPGQGRGEIHGLQGAKATGIPLALARGPQPCPAVPANYSLFASFPSALAIFPSRLRAGAPTVLSARPLTNAIRFRPRPEGIRGKSAETWKQPRRGAPGQGRGEIHGLQGAKITGIPLALARGPQPCPAVPANYSLFASFPSALAIFPSRSREGLNRALSWPLTTAFPVCCALGKCRGSTARNSAPKREAPGQGRGEIHGLNGAKTTGIPLALARGPQPCPAVPANYSLFASFPSALAVFPSRLREGQSARAAPCSSSASSRSLKAFRTAHPSASLLK